MALFPHSFVLSLTIVDKIVTCTLQAGRGHIANTLLNVQGEIDLGSRVSATYTICTQRSHV